MKDFIILEGPDGVGKSTLQNFIYAYFNFQNKEDLISVDFDIKKTPFYSSISEVIYQDLNTTIQTKQHLRLSIQIENFYKNILPLVGTNTTLVLDRSFISTYVYSVFSGIPKQDAKILISPIIGLWEQYIYCEIKPKVIIIERDYSLKQNELNTKSFCEISKIYKSLKSDNYFKKLDIQFISNRGTIEDLWFEVCSLLNYKYLPSKDILK